MTPRAYIIQRHPKIFGETKDDFMPERWLGEEGAKIPDSCFRPYERGPRRCTGSELANLEVRIILACIARYFEFVKVGQGELDLDEKGQPQLDEKGFYKTKSVMFSVSETPLPLRLIRATCADIRSYRLTWLPLSLSTA